MKTFTALAIACFLVITACGDDNDSGGGTTTIDGCSGRDRDRLHERWARGQTDTWVLGADGTVLGPDGYTGTVSATDRSRLAAAVEAADFFNLDAEYVPEDQCCDRFTST